jgi:hypothetical protein
MVKVTAFDRVCVYKISETFHIRISRFDFGLSLETRGEVFQVLELSLVMEKAGACSKKVNPSD